MLALPSDSESYTSLLTPEEIEKTQFLKLLQAKQGRSLPYYLRYVGTNLKASYQLARTIRQKKVSIVHINEILDVHGALAAKIAGAACVWHIRAELSPWPVMHQFLPRLAAALSDTIVVVSQSALWHMFQNQGIETNGKAVVINNPGPNPTKFHPDVKGDLVRREFGFSENTFVVTLVGKLSKRKGHEVLVRAAPKVLEHFPNTQFMIVGGELSGKHHQKYAKILKDLPHKLKVEERIVFTGFRSDVPQIMAASDIITHCSTYPDPFPGVVLQGMAVGKPVIASALGGPREQIEDGVSGILVEPGAPSALANAICSLLEDKEKRESLGESASKRVRKKFNAETYFQKLTQSYERLLAE
jgi:glycosyltransferase involved in cell wall biosynthesis